MYVAGLVARRPGESKEYHQPEQAHEVTRFVDHHTRQDHNDGQAENCGDLAVRLCDEMSGLDGQKKDQ